MPLLQGLKPLHCCGLLLPPASRSQLALASNGPHRDGVLRHLGRSLLGAQVHRRPPRRPPLCRRPHRQQRRKDQVHAGVWPAYGNKKFETLSYLPPLSVEGFLKQVEYLIRSNWVPCIEFSKVGFVCRENATSPGYYDGRYWTMWKLPMFGCTDASQVLKELEEAKKTYPDCYLRIIGFDNMKQVQCVSFIAYKPPNSE
ncbi:hypothetical protein ACP4OV_019197 [Aristida adscensionis]